MSEIRRVHRTDSGDMSGLVAAMRKQLEGNAQVSADASKLLRPVTSAPEGGNGCSADGSAQPTIVMGTGICLSDLDKGKK